MKKKVKQENAQENIMDILLDEDNKEPIVLFNEAGRKIGFEQVAIIPYDDKLYCILKPIDHIDDVDDDEAIVFYVNDPYGEMPTLVVEKDEAKAIAVFDEYYKLLDDVS